MCASECSWRHCSPPNPPPVMNCCIARYTHTHTHTNAASKFMSLSHSVIPPSLLVGYPGGIEGPPVSSLWGEVEVWTRGRLRFSVGCTQGTVPVQQASLQVESPYVNAVAHTAVCVSKPCHDCVCVSVRGSCSRGPRVCVWSGRPCCTLPPSPSMRLHRPLSLPNRHPTPLHRARPLG